MNKKKIEKIIKAEVESEVPNVLDKVLLNCEERENKEIMSKKTFKFKPILSFAYVFIFVILFGIISFTGYNKLNGIDSIIEFDVNPSIEIKINKNNKIVETKALNEDGKIILQDMNLKGSDLNIGVNAIIGSMYKNGYISNLKNSILVTVNNKDREKGKKLQKEITDQINSCLDTYNIESAIVTQQYESNNNNNKLSKEYGISQGKAEFIEKILEKNLANKDGKKYTFEELKDLNINELNAILNSKNITIEKVNVTGKASTKSYIGTNKAKSIVLADANIAESNIKNFEIELDYEYGTMIYDISFDANRTEYEYEIDATTGKIINKHTERDDDYYQGSSAKNTQATPIQSSQPSKPTTSTQTTQTIQNTNSNNYISRERAKSIALSNAGVNENNIRDFSIELDYENGKTVYEISFEVGNTDYEYEIDAISWKIVYKDIEKD